MLQDECGRTIEYLRLSVTDRCNLRCTYCMPQQGVALLRHEDVLRFEEIVAFVRVAVEKGVRAVRLTGGEPLAKRRILELVERLAAVEGLEDLAMTTNATMLAPVAKQLKELGVRRVNIGLPSLDPDTYRTITRPPEGTGLPQALEGLEAALREGLSPVKVNVVVLRGLNEDVEPFADLARRLPVQVRFIEYMPIGPADADHVVPAREILARLGLEPQSLEPPACGRGPALTIRTDGWAGSLGIIAPITDHFCDRCNRLRLTSDGKLRTCLFSDEEVDLKPALRPEVDCDALRGLLEHAVASKPARMPRHVRLGRRWMGQIGG